VDCLAYLLPIIALTAADLLIMSQKLRMFGNQPFVEMIPDSTGRIGMIEEVTINKLNRLANNLLPAGQIRQDWSDEDVGF